MRLPRSCWSLAMTDCQYGIALLSVNPSYFLTDDGLVMIGFVLSFVTRV
ncbi:hypothetical protein KAX35_03555 [candidate division WOR-3 bacterium]|nr:hypothetical protein [candidate division WOR-3 bacterium]